ncbi:hypothetical protein AGMMS50248_01530 [Deltaproteobacteria bacterium]|nr:hypothetical protein AGMMS50248_01530 [Deltaproteobacteria bacterium]
MTRKAQYKRLPLSHIHNAQAHILGKARLQARNRPNTQQNKSDVQPDVVRRPAGKSALP